MNGQRTNKRRLVLAAAAAAAIGAGSAAGPAGAQGYPARPILMAVGFAPGGGTDIVGRLIADKLSQRVAQPVVVANVSGAGGTIAAQQVAQATPDGYRLLFVSSAHTMSAALRPDLPYDAVKSFAAVTKIADTPNLIVVHPSLGASSLSDLIALARKQPGKLNYGSGGVGTNAHMSTELLKSMTGIQITHVPYKGAGPFLSAMLGNEVQIGFATLPTALPHIRGGRLKGLAVTTRTRSAAIPEMPTADESGVPGYEYSVWFGLLAPAGTPPAVVNRLRDAVVAALADPALQERLKADGSISVGSTPAEFGRFMASELAKWKGVVKKAGIKGN